MRMHGMHGAAAKRTQGRHGAPQPVNTAVRTARGPLPLASGHKGGTPGGLVAPYLARFGHVPLLSTGRETVRWKALDE
jgi:hypothetical protein